MKQLQLLWVIVASFSILGWCTGILCWGGTSAAWKSRLWESCCSEKTFRNCFCDIYICWDCKNGVSSSQIHIYVRSRSTSKQYEQHVEATQMACLICSITSRHILVIGNCSEPLCDNSMNLYYWFLLSLLFHCAGKI